MAAQRFQTALDSWGTARVFQRIAEAHINVRYSYLATRNRLVISSEKPQAILDAIRST